MTHPLLFDCAWTQQWKYESAEAFYQQVLAGTAGAAAPKMAPADNQGSKVTQGSKLKSEIAQARQNIQKALEEGTGDKPAGGAVDQHVLQRIKSLETENSNLKKSSQDLTALVNKLEARVMALEKSSAAAGGSTPASRPVEPESKSEEPADEDSDGSFNPFDSDSESSEDEETKQRIAAYAAKKANKKVIIAKSSLLIDVKPWSDETDMGELEGLVRTIELDGLLWGQAKLIPVGYGIKKLQINAVIEDAKVSTDDLEDKITGFEDFVQSMDIAAFNKI